MLQDIIPVKYRQRLYIAYALVIVALGAIQIAYATLGDPVPEWYTVTTQVVLYLGAAFGLVAAANTPITAVTPRGDNDPGRHSA